MEHIKQSVNSCICRVVVRRMDKMSLLVQSRSGHMPA